MTGGAEKWIAVLGGARRFSSEQLEAAYRCGLRLAQRGRHLLTGATGGVPYAAALGVKDGGGFVVGISPATNAKDHVRRYRKPLNPVDLVIYSGLGIDGRAPLIMRSAGAAIFIGGEMGTLAEFAAGWICGCPYLGLLENTGGITADLRRITASIATTWGSRIVRARDAVELTDKICDLLDTVKPKPWLRQESDAVADIVDAVAELRPC